MNNPRSLAARLPSQKSEDLSKSGVILKSKIRNLCRSLIANHEDHVRQPLDSVEKLEKIFWNDVLHSERNSSAENQLDVETLLVDAVLVSGEDYARQVKNSLDNLLEYESGTQIAFFLSLLQNEEPENSPATLSRKSYGDGWKGEQVFWDIQKEQLNYDCQGSSPEIFPPRSEIFESVRTRNSLQNDRPKRPNRIAVPPLHPAQPAIPKISHTQVTQQRYVGDCLFAPAVNDFTVTAYQGAFNGPVLSVTVQQFIKEICKVFKGLPSSLFQQDEEDQSFRAVDTFCVEGLSPAVAESLCAEAATGGSMVWKLRVFLDSANQEPVGDTFRQFYSGVKSYLSTWHLNVDCSTKVSRNLLEICDIMRRFSRPLVALLEICSDVVEFISIGLPDSSYALLQYLYDRAEECLQTESLLSLVLFLLEESAKPFFFFASRLALCGHFDDPFGEFGVILAEKVEKMPVEQLIFSEEIIPSFLSEALLDCVESGRCLQLIRAVDRLHPILPLESCDPSGPSLLHFSVTEDLEKYRTAMESYAGDIRVKILNKNQSVSASLCAPGNIAKTGPLIPRITVATIEPSFFQQNLERNLGSLKALLQQEILPVTSIQIELAEFALLDLFINEQNLLVHLRIIRNYFFLSDGSFSLPFVTGIFQRAAKHSLRSCLSIIAFLDIFESSLAEQNYPAEWMERVTRDLSLAVSCSSTSDKESYDIADYLGLQYKISWPMGMLLTADIMEKASAVFSRLLRIKGCVWAMQDAFALLADAQYADNSSHRHQLNLFRHNIGQVVTALDDYFMEDVMECAWQALQFQLENARRFEHLREAVAEYVDTVYHRCFFQSSKKAAKTLPHLTHYAMRFAHHLHNGHSFAELENTYNIFLKCCKIFLNALSKSKDSPSSLADQLDFNGFLQDLSVENVLKQSASRNAYATL